MDLHVKLHVAQDLKLENREICGCGQITQFPFVGIFAKIYMFKYKLLFWKLVSDVA